MFWNPNGRTKTLLGSHRDPATQELPSMYLDSQNSSMGDSSTSQMSHVRPPSSGYAEHSQAHRGLEAITPSTPLSNYSSQEHALDGQTDTESMNASPAGGLGERTHQHLLVRTGEPRQSFPMYPALVSKRMANGDIKSPKESLPTSPLDSALYGHSRTTTTSSRGSQIGEVSYAHPFE